MRKLILLNVIILFLSTINSTAQEKLKDTLFFKLDGKYVFESEYDQNFYLLEDSSDIGRGTFLFEKIKVEKSKHPREILCLKKYVQSSKYYNRHKTVKLNDYKLWEHFVIYTIYLVKKNKITTEYIQVYPTVQRVV